MSVAQRRGARWWWPAHGDTRSIETSSRSPLPELSSSSSRLSMKLRASEGPRGVRPTEVLHPRSALYRSRVCGRERLAECHAQKFGSHLASGSPTRSLVGGFGGRASVRLPFDGRPPFMRRRPRTQSGSLCGPVSAPSTSSHDRCTLVRPHASPHARSFDGRRARQETRL